MPYVDQGLAHAGSAEILFSGMFDEPAGCLARTMPRGAITANSVSGLSSGGAVNVRSIPLPAGLVVSQLAIVFGGTAAVNPTHFWLALTDPQLNVLAVSADQLAAAQTNAAMMKLAMTVPYVIQQTGLYYVAVSSSASTTAPTLTGNTPAGGIPGPAPVMAGTAGSLGPPPAVGVQINSGTITAGVGSSFAAWVF